MKPLYMVELRPDIVTLMRFLQGQGLLKNGADEDFGYGIHAWMAAAFDELKPTVWRLLMDKRRPPRVLGYSYHTTEELQQRMQEFADPSVCAICPPSMMASKPMPSWQSGRKLGFDLQCCPVGRKSRSGIEKDLFLIHADAAGDEELSRETVYGDWAKERLQRDDAAIVNSIQMIGFRLVRQTRQVQGLPAKREQKHPLRPQALFKGVLTIREPEAFMSLLNRGVGRHRSFGYGMLLLRPTK